MVHAACHRSCFGVYTSLECWTHDTQEHCQLLLSGQTVKLSGWSHGPSRALSCDRVHVLSLDHDSSPLMTHHVVSPYLLIYQPHLWLAATLSFSSPYPYCLPHFWLDATLSFSYHYPYRFAPAILLTGPHTPLSFYIYPYHCQAFTNMVCAP